MRVFVDVGAHYGESLEVALDPAWGFDLIYSLEPAQTCHEVLRGFKDRRLRLVQKGLSDQNRTATLYGGGLLGASVYADKDQLDPTATSREEVIELVRASEWLRGNIAPGDELYLKMNCEGSEVDVLTDLLDSGAIDLVHRLYVDFDILKVPAEAHRAAEVETRLRDAGVQYATPANLGAGAKTGVSRWLRQECPRVKPSPGAAMRHRLGLDRPPYVVARSVAEAVLSRRLLRSAAARFGRQARSRRSADRS